MKFDETFVSFLFRRNDKTLALVGENSGKEKKRERVLESVDNANRRKFETHTRAPRARTGGKNSRSPITCVAITSSPSPSGRVSGFPNKFHGAKERGRGTLNRNSSSRAWRIWWRASLRNRAAYRAVDKKEKRRKKGKRKRKKKKKKKKRKKREK